MRSPKSGCPIRTAPNDSSLSGICKSTINVSSTLCTNSKAFEETPFDGLFISARICLMVAKLVNNGRPSHMEPNATCNALMGHSQLAFLRISFVPCVGAETTEVLPSSPFSCHYRRSYECCHEIPFASCLFFFPRVTSSFTVVFRVSYKGDCSRSCFRMGALGSSYTKVDKSYTLKHSFVTLVSIFWLDYSV